MSALWKSFFSSLKRSQKSDETIKSLLSVILELSKEHQARLLLNSKRVSPLILALEAQRYDLAVYLLVIPLKLHLPSLQV
jgi:hypothetical protein